jgi:hypothetical protein
LQPVLLLRCISVCCCCVVAVYEVQLFVDASPCLFAVVSRCWCCRALCDRHAQRVPDIVVPPEQKHSSTWTGPCFCSGGTTISGTRCAWRSHKARQHQHRDTTANKHGDASTNNCTSYTATTQQQQTLIHLNSKTGCKSQ